MAMNSKQIKDLNREDRASQNIRLGNFLASLETSSSGVYSGSNIQANLNTHISTTGSNVHGLGTASTQSASAINLTGGFINGVKFGTATDYATFGNDGTLTFSGSATTWDDVVMPLTQTKQGANLKPDYDFTNVGYLFPQNDPAEILYLTVQMPHGYKEGSDIHPHVHWSQGTSACAIFKADYKWFNLGDPIPTAFQTFVMNTAVKPYTSGSIQQLTGGSAVIIGTGKEISSLMNIKLYRDDNVYTGDVLTFQFDVHIEKDSIGSKTILVK